MVLVIVGGSCLMVEVPIRAMLGLVLSLSPALPAFLFLAVSVLHHLAGGFQTPCHTFSGAAVVWPASGGAEAACYSRLVFIPFTLVCVTRPHRPQLQQ